MQSGKSTELLRLCNRYQLSNKKVLLIKSSTDTRGKFILTHDKKEKECIVTNNLFDIDENIINEYDVIGIDECQFFDTIGEFADKIANSGKVVILSGLDSDFQRNPFKNITDLVAKAEHVVKLTAICENCGNDASFSKRKDINNKNLIDVGSKDKYTSVCRKCF